MKKKFISLGSQMVCVSTIFFSSGCQVTTESKAKLDLLNEQITNILQRNSVTARQALVNTNDIRIEDITFRCKNASFETAQKIDADVKFITNVQGDIALDLKNAIEAAVKQDISSQSKIVQDFMSQALNGRTIAEITNSIIQSIRNNVTSENVVDIINQYDLTNRQVIRGVTFEGDVCNFLATQQIFLRLMAVDIINLAQRAVISNADIIKIIDAAKSQSDAESKGIGDIIRNIVDALKSLGTAWIIIIGLIIVALIIGFVLVFRSFISSDVGKFAAEKAAKKAGV